MAFELFFCAGSYNQVSHLWREETSQPSHALDFAHLIEATLLFGAGSEAEGQKPEIARLPRRRDSVIAMERFRHDAT